MTTAYLGLGSNLGDRLTRMRAGRERLERAESVTIIRSSALYETEPVGGPEGQGHYFNAVLEIETSASAKELLELCQQIEHSEGRTREVHHGPRTLDLDLLLFDDRCSDDPHLTLPHPRLHERRFVLVPLCDLNPELEHPRLHLSMTTLLAGLNGEEVILVKKDW